MKVLIVEDELSVAKNLCDLLGDLEDDIDVLVVLETVTETIDWLKINDSPDLGFFDIRLADGDSFKVFESIKIDFPIIFTTAYDEYALKAFKVNSVDYLLKPISKYDLSKALKKYKAIYKNINFLDNQKLNELIKEIRLSSTKQYKQNFLVYIKDKIIPLSTVDIAYFYLENGIVYCISHKNEKFVIDQSLEITINQINPFEFFRANRQIIISRKSVKLASNFFNRKLKLKINPNPKFDVIISKEKVPKFKKWLTG